MTHVRQSPSGPVIDIDIEDLEPIEAFTVIGNPTSLVAKPVASRVVNEQVVGGALGSVKGVPADGVAGVLQDLFALQLAPLIRFFNQGDVTSGSIPSYPVPNNITMVTFNGVTNVLDGVAVPAGGIGQLLIVQHIGAGTTTIPHESASAGLPTERFRLGNYGANRQVLILGGTASPAQTAAFLHDGTRWVWITQALGVASIPVTALQPTVNNCAVGFQIFVQFAAGGGGAADDVILVNANLPVGFRILDVLLDVATAVVGSSCQLRTATGGGGGTVSAVLSSAATGGQRNSVIATNTIAALGTLVLRRSDSGVAGSIIVSCIPI